MASSPRRLWLLAAALGAAAATLAVLACRYARLPGDLALTLWLQSLRSPALDGVMRGLSWLFDSWRQPALVIAGSLGVLLWLGRVRAALVLLAGASTVTGSVLKLLIGRARPPETLVAVWDVQTNYGFPSGHALLTTAVLGFLAYLGLTYLRHRALKIVSATVLTLLILLTGLSRIYLGAHWPSDVLGGFVIGGLLLTLVIMLERWAAARPGLLPRPPPA